MKRIKLFESFQSNNLLDIKNDIESILYNIDDLGYDMKFDFHAEGFNSISCDDIDIESLLSTYNKSIESRKYKPIERFIIGLKLPSDLDFSDGKDYQYHYNKLRKKLEWFLVLLKDHLDYIDPNHIYIWTFYNSQYGATGASIIVKL